VTGDSVPPLRTSAYWVILLRSALIGAFGGTFAVIFISLEHAAQSVPVRS